MNIDISVFGRLHAYYLANQLEKRHSLRHLYTTYPKREVVKYGIPRSTVTSFPAIEVAFRLWLKLPRSLLWGSGMLIKFAERYDSAVRHRLQANADIFHGWSTYSEYSLMKATSLGALCTLQRGSAHIEFQRDILREEYELEGTRGVLPHPAVVDREMREYHLASYIFVPSEFARGTFLAKGLPPEKVIRVPLGVSTSQFWPVASHDDIFRVIYAGTMSLRKGVQYLIQAFSELRLPRAELWLVGQMQPEMERTFHRYAHSFRHFPHVPQSTLRDYYGQCSVFALPSIEDGFGVVLTQAMACGLPIICTTNTGGPDVIDHGVEGYIVPIRDVDAIKNSILSLYQNRELCAEMGRKARLRSTSALTWDHYGELIHSTFVNLLAGKGSATQSSNPEGSREPQ